MALYSSTVAAISCSSLGSFLVGKNMSPIMGADVISVKPPYDEKL